VKRIIIFLAPIVLLIMYGIGCSKNHEAPTFGKYDTLNTPADVVATFNAGTEMIDIAWTMDDLDGVVDYFIGVSDSSVFNDGHIVEFFTDIPRADIQNTPYNKSFNLEKCLPGAVVDADSVILYIRVSAVYNNDQFKNFIGPQSSSDSTIVRQN